VRFSCERFTIFFFCFFSFTPYPTTHNLIFCFCFPGSRENSRALRVVINPASAPLLFFSFFVLSFIFPGIDVAALLRVLIFYVGFTGNWSRECWVLSHLLVFHDSFFFFFFAPASFLLFFKDVGYRAPSWCLSLR